MSIESIASAFTIASQAQVTASVQTSVLRMSLNAQKAVSADLIAALDLSGRGRMVDVRG